MPDVLNTGKVGVVINLLSVAGGWLSVSRWLPILGLSIPVENKEVFIMPACPPGPRDHL